MIFVYSLEDLEAQKKPTEIWEDNASCILMSENHTNRDRSRHVDVKVHYLREDGLRQGSFAILVPSSPFAVASSAGSSRGGSSRGGRSISGHQRSHLSNLGFEGRHFRGVVIGGAGKESCSVGIDRPGHMGLIFSMVSIGSPFNKPAI